MRSTLAASAALNQSGTSVRVQTDAAAKVLDGILRKPGKHGATPPAVENKRRAIGQGTCAPSKALLLCLENNGCLEEFIAAIRILMNPGEQRHSIADIARHVTKAERTIAEPFEELFSGRASTRDMSVIRHTAHLLRDECEQLEEAAAHTMYIAPAQRSA